MFRHIKKISEKFKGILRNKIALSQKPTAKSRDKYVCMYMTNYHIADGSIKLWYQATGLAVSGCLRLEGNKA